MRVLRRLLQRKFVRDTIVLQFGKLGMTGFALLSAVLIARLMGTETFGEWALVQSFLVIWQSLNLTGIGTSTSTRMAIAVGAKDSNEIVDLAALYVKMSLGWSFLLTTTLVILGPLVAGLSYRGDTRIGMLAVWLSLTDLPDALYNLIIITLQSQRSMRAVALLQNVNQAVLFLCTAIALLINPTAESMIAGRLTYSVVTMVIAFLFYNRLRSGFPLAYPPLSMVLRRARSVPVGPYWRFGLANAIDRNIASLFTELPLQLVGVLAGKSAAGYLEVAYKAMTIPSVLTSAVFDNLQAVVPQAVGRHDFAQLWGNFMRVLLTLMTGSLAFYMIFALAAPIIVPVTFGERWNSAIPVIVVLTVYGMVTTVGGIFGPLYRAMNLLRSAVLVKIIALMVMIVPGLLLIDQSGAVGGAWFVNGLYGVSVILTATMTLPTLKRKAEQQTVTQ